MINKKNFLLFLLVGIMAFSLVLGGCQSADEETEEEVEAVAEETVEEELALSDWEGVWNNINAYLEDEEMEESFEELAENEGVSVEEARNAFMKDREVSFNALEITEDKIIFLDGFKDKDGKELEAVEYEYTGRHMAKHGNFDQEWYSFEAKGDYAGGYKTILAMPVHGEEALTHFHLRYGNSVEELLARDEWYPTLVKPDSTYDQIHEEVTE